MQKRIILTKETDCHVGKIETEKPHFVYALPAVFQAFDNMQLSSKIAFSMSCVAIAVLVVFVVVA